jgi:hypothetical protein
LFVCLFVLWVVNNEKYFMISNKTEATFSGARPFPLVEPSLTVVLQTRPFPLVEPSLTAVLQTRPFPLVEPSLTAVLQTRPFPLVEPSLTAVLQTDAFVLRLFVSVASFPTPILVHFLLLYYTEQTFAIYYCNYAILNFFFL